MNTKKKIISLAFLGLLAISFAFSAMAAAPHDAHYWTGNIDFWETTVMTATKTNTDTTSYISFSGAAEPMNIWITGKIVGSTSVASSKTKFARYDEKLLETGAGFGNNVRLLVAREYVLDQKVSVNGYFRP